MKQNLSVLLTRGLSQQIKGRLSRFTSCKQSNFEAGISFQYRAVLGDINPTMTDISFGRDSGSGSVKPPSLCWFIVCDPFIQDQS